MTPSPGSDRMAVLFDLENVAIGVRAEDSPPFDVERVLARLGEEGRILLRRAYADWERWSPYRRAFDEAGVERIDMPSARLAGKNAADIKMVVDAMEIAFTKPHIDTFALVTGDSDFSPLVAKLREWGKRTVGVGVENSTSRLLVESCDAFVVYDDLVAPGAGEPERLTGLPDRRREAFRELLEAAESLRRADKELHSSLVKDTIKRRRPHFREEVHGYASFNSLLEDAQSTGLVRLRRDPRSGTYVIDALLDA